MTPEDAQTMAQVRAGVDAVDRALVELLGTRARYMAAAARIKPARDQVRDEARKAQVLANVAAQARDHGLPEALTADLWGRLVEWSIAYELGLWDAVNPPLPLAGEAGGGETGPAQPQPFANRD